MTTFKQEDMTCVTFSGNTENEFHKDDTINDLIKWVRNTEETKDAMWNAERILRLSYKRLPLWKKILYIFQ